ncbi:MAG: hypothetical protein NZM04_00325 [Methylacidiphilales bacterium]|nr:hypothetical protein [Candidatus Methylacidiphilales bacterium]MDW8350177.1 hypothetical protein [Verrucomicrobiae bacterium]
MTQSADPDKFIPQISASPPVSYPQDSQQPTSTPEKKRSRSKRFIFILLLGGLLIGITPYLYNWLKVRRAENLVRSIVNNSNNLVANENFLKVRSAYNLAPNSPIVLRAMADALLQVQQPYAARSFLSRLVAMPQSTPDDHKIYAELLLKQRDHATLIKWLEPHLKKNPVPPHILEIQSWLLLEQGKIADAIQVARSTQKNYPNELSPGALTLAQLLLTDKNPTHQEEGAQILKRLIEDPQTSNKIRIEAARTFSHLNYLAPEEAEEVSRILRLNPLATPTDNVRALQLLTRLKLRTPEQLISEVQHLAKRNSGSLAAILDWLLDNKLYDVALELVPKEIAKNDNLLMNLHLSVLQRAGMWDTLLKTLEEESDILDHWQRLLHTVYYMRYKGTPLQYRDAWEDLMRHLPREPAYLRTIAMAALDLQEYLYATTLFNRLTAHPMFAREAHLHLIALGDRNHSFEDWLRILQRAEPYFKNDSSYNLQLDYCYLMLNIDRHLVIPRILQAFNENPTSIVHRCLAALALLFDGKAQDGYRLLTAVEINWSIAQPRWLVVKACLEAASGDQVAARLTRSQIDEKQLKIEEINLLNRYVSAIPPRSSN